MYFPTAAFTFFLTFIRARFFCFAFCFARCVLGLAFRRDIYHSLAITSVETSFSYNVTCILSEFNTKTPCQNLARIKRSRDFDWFMTGGVSKRAKRPISSYKPRETLIRLLRRNKILQIPSTKKGNKLAAFKRIVPKLLRDVNQYQWSKNEFAFSI